MQKLTLDGQMLPALFKTRILEEDVFIPILTSLQRNSNIIKKKLVLSSAKPNTEKKKASFKFYSNKKQWVYK